jgi:hypothetical protein
VIQASVTGNGAGSVNGQIVFDARHERQRAGLVLANGKVYIAWGSFCDNSPYHGWLMSYSFDGTALHQVNVYNDSVDGSEGGIWGAGGAIAADSTGAIYYISGNGDFNLNTGGKSSSDSFVKLDANLNRLDYFSPFNQSCLQAADADLGSSGPLLEPTHNLIVGAGKEGRIYVIDRNNMGKYNTIANPCTNQGGNISTDKVVQESVSGQVGGLFNTPSYWSDGTHEYVYIASVNRQTGAYLLDSTGKFTSFTPTSKTPESFGYTGGNLVISSNGTSNGILWAIDRGDANGPILRAYNASNLGNELYNSNQNANRDAIGGFVKFTCPTVANGQVFVPGSASLVIFGQINGSTPPPPITYNNAGVSITSSTNFKTANYDGSGYSYDQAALSAVGINPNGSVLANGLSFIWPGLPANTLDNYQAVGQTIPIVPADNATTMGFLGSATNGNTSGTATITYTDGTTQNFTLGFTDWAKPTLAFGNKLVSTMTDRLGPTGKQSINVYLFSTQVTLQSNLKVRSITLPAATGNKSALHVFAITTVGPLGSYNNIGTSDDGNSKGANFDNVGNSYSAQGLQSQGSNPGDNAFFRGTTGAVFQWPSGNSGEVNNYIAAGQTLAVNPLNNASILGIAGASTGGPSTGTATINYADNSHQTFTLGLSDWTLNGGGSKPSFGNSIMYTMPYRNTVNGPQFQKTYVFFAAVSLQQGKTVQSITLPSKASRGQMHIFAVTTKTADTADYNNIGTSDDINHAAANFDGGGVSYSAQALQAAGVTPWQLLTVNGVTFQWPNIGSGGNNNYNTNGQQIPPISITPVTNATTLSFLGSATNGPSTVNVTITYSDASTQTAQVSFSDWTLGAGTVQPISGNSIAITTTYRNKPTSTENIKAYIFYTQVTLKPGLTIQSVSIAPTANRGHAHIFAIGTK